MEYLLDNPETEKLFQEILAKINPLKNGEVVNSMVKRGISYKVNFGASIPLLHELAAQYPKNHLLAFKLWNKQWRETMILATLLEDPDQMNENQIDFWVSQLPSVEMAEQAAMNLFANTRFAFGKAYEYCFSKKHLVKIAGLLMIGRLALANQEATNDQFEPFFEIMPPLSKDPKLSIVFSRVFVQLGMRNVTLHQLVIQHAQMLKTIQSDVAIQNADTILDELDNEDALEIVTRRSPGTIIDSDVDI